MKKIIGEDIIKEICDRQDLILENIARESIDVYLFLKNEYKKGDIKNNAVFQFVFRSYYRLDNAGLTAEFKKRYFELLADEQIDLEILLRDLYKFETRRHIKEVPIKAVQFSFSTKLLHTLDNNKPIFDTEVSRVIHRSVTGVNAKEKIESCKKIYDDLIKTYKDLTGDKKIKEVVVKFRLKFDVDIEKMTDIKVLDFIVWSLGKLKKKNLL